MTSWQRRARLVAIVVAISVAGGAYWASGTRRTLAPPPTVTPLEPTVTAEMQGGEAAQSSGAREDFSVDFEEQKTYQDGRTVATGLTVRVANRGGKSFVVTGNEGTVGDRAGVDRDERRRRAEGLRRPGRHRRLGHLFQRRGHRPRARPGDLHARRHQGRRHRLHLRLAARHDVAARPGGGARRRRPTAGAIDATAGAVRRGPRAIATCGSSAARSWCAPGQIIEADEAMVYLLPDRDDPDRIELRGNARITGGEGMGALRAMQARDINLDYADDGRTLRARHAGRPGQRRPWPARRPAPSDSGWPREFIDIALGPDGAVTNLSSRERVGRDPAGDADARRPAPSSRSSSAAPARPGPG